MSIMSISKSKKVALQQAAYVWEFENNRTIALFHVKAENENEKLMYRVFNNNIMIRYQRVIFEEEEDDAPKRSLKEQLSYLKKSAPRLNTTPIFRKRIIFLRKDRASFSIRLIQRDGLEWEIRRKGKIKKGRIPTSHFFRFNPSHLHPDCASTTTAAIAGKVNQLFQGTPNLRALAEFFSTLEIVTTKAKMQHPKPGKNFYLKPITMDSDMDKEIKVSKYMWALTLIKYYGKSNQHAEIAIEGIRDTSDYKGGIRADEETTYYNVEEEEGEDGQVNLVVGAKHSSYFRLLVHFTGKEIKFETHPKIIFIARSETWKVPCGTVRGMIANIINEKNTPLGYTQFGRFSIFSNGQKDNCLTWALRHLEGAQIATFDKDLSKIVALTSFYMKNQPVCADSNKL